jgi:hypothetical protein
MNKTLIAIAIAAALPVAAQADATLTGSVSTKYKNSAGDAVIDTDASLTITSSEVLANGMTATASFAITADSNDDTENAGTATLAGDFGTLTAGSIDADGAFQAGDVAGVVGNTTESTASTASSVYGVHFAGDLAGLSVAAQLNAATGANGAASSVAVASTSTSNYVAAYTAPTKSTQFSATYDFNGVVAGYSYASDLADDSSTASHSGIHEGQTAVGISYAFGDLVVTAGKVNYADTATATKDAVISGTYTMAVDALTIVAQMDNYHSSTDSNDYQINMSMAISDSVTLSSEVDKNKTTTMVATFTEGDVTATVAKTDDGTTDASISLDYGNADLTIGRVGSRAVNGTVLTASAAEYTHVTYKVAF